MSPLLLKSSRIFAILLVVVLALSLGADIQKAHAWNRGISTSTISKYGITIRVSVSSSDVQGVSESYGSSGSISTDGRYVVFESYADNLINDDTNGNEDIFVHDRQTGQTERVSISSSGEQGNGQSYTSSISTDGRYVTFISYSSNLVSGDTNGYRDIFIHDRQNGQTELVSLSSSGEQGNSESRNPSISANGRFVAFSSNANNLVSDDTNGNEDIFVHDRQTGQTERVSLSSSGEQGNSFSYRTSISTDGRFVAFESHASNLITGDTNGYYDIFVRDRQTGQTERVSLSSSNGQGNSEAAYPSISADGRYVAFASWANNLASGDNNGVWDVFVRDRQTGQTEHISVSLSGGSGNNESKYPSISADGRYVAFTSNASNLVSGDANGYRDIFIHDRQTGQTELVSFSSSGEQGNNESRNPSISADGHFVAFSSYASILVSGDTNDRLDVFVRMFLEYSQYLPIIGR